MSDVLKIRKKPVEVEAMIFDGTIDTARKICQWANDDPNPKYYPEGYVCDFVTRDSEPGKAFDFLVWTAEGDMRAAPGDYVIKGVEGEFYPCKPEIIKKTYEV